MTLFDIVLLLILLAALAIGYARGFVASAGVLAGLVAGGAAALWAAPTVGRLIAEPVWRPLAELATWAVLLGIGAAVGGAVGAWLRRGVDRTPLRVLDRIAGGVVSLVVAALVVSLAATGIAATGIPTVSADAASSRVVRSIDSLIPAPVQQALAQLRGTLAADGLPALGALLDHPAADPAPPIALDTPAVTAAMASVARITGVAYACGVSQTGSGFAIGADTVVTNAHVVAGVKEPTVQLPDGTARPGRIVAFDPEQDLAIIRAPGLGARPLQLSSTLPAGAAAVVAGYPYGGPLTAGDATVIATGTAPVPDIYDQGTAMRPLYSLRATVRPGNSGGPVLTAKGTVAGVVFARVEGASDRGYAIVETAVKDLVARSGSLSATVPSGHCTS
ncbi:MarP family serine protease [Microbacterium sp.]|uniref:MarP family serine protease n=1 Tax=Microbacterium sp. TaxID=51671 RepID=UPI003A91B060